MARAVIWGVFLALFLKPLPLAQLTTGGQNSASPSKSSGTPSPVTPSISQQPPATAVPNPAPDALGEANRLYGRGEFDAAIQKYEAILQGTPKSAEAYAELTRVYLKQRDVQQAYDTVSKGLQVADSAPLRVALGEVYFRQGKIAEAELEWLNVINGGHARARAYLGVARVREALSLYRQAKAMIDKAHELDSSDPDIQGYWVNNLSLAERIQYWESYLASPTNDDPETRAGIQHSLDYLKAWRRQPRHRCRLTRNVTSTETSLVRLLSDPQHLRGYGVAVSLNGEKAKLMFDTGAGGILIDRSLARKAGISKLSETTIGGIGDKGRSGGYYGLASSIKIGELEFQDCTVEVLEKRSVMGEDGLIGGNVFSAFLVEVDFPHEKLRLKELPRRPDESTSSVALETGEEGSEWREDEVSEKAESDASAKPAKPRYRGPRDRYIAPEMRSYTQVLRFGHILLVPTRIGDMPAKLFLLDTGAFTNHISLNAAREITKVRSDPHMRVKGLSGSVANVYSADKAVLRFGRLRQENQDMVTFDLSHLSDRVGTEVSGILGFTTLHLLDIRIDYRDGLVDFSYRPGP